MTVRILAFSGSGRKDSIHKKLLKNAVKGALDAGADVTVLDLKDYPIPIYDGDLEESDGIPEKAREIRTLFKSHDGVLLACPEYNSSITPLLKNIIDWVSRPENGESGLVHYSDKTAALLAASGGNLAGLRGLFTVRQILSVLGMHVIPNQFGLSGANTAFDEHGIIIDENQRKLAECIGAALTESTAKLKG
jgi:NAD(P)H-dependent FMN reductase